MKIKNYENSGKSTPEAIADAKAKLGPMAKILSPFTVMRMHCDGADCSEVGKTNGTLLANGIWEDSSGWKHDHELDFCPDCQANGKAAAAVAAGVKPMGR